MEEEPRQRQGKQERCARDPCDRQVALLAGQLTQGVAAAPRGSEGRADAAEDRAAEGGDGPDRADGDDAGTDEANLLRPHCPRRLLRARCTGPIAEGGEQRHREAPGQGYAGEQGEAGPEPDEVADADESRREAGGETE
ncbi:hypothetical protein GCM10025880_54450 [Methylorubrum aminovorans]|nr:hypothetical protein GCM10025880_54450 [Methylorubrum aminovorans]